MPRLLPLLLPRLRHLRVRRYSAASEPPRINQVGIQYLSNDLHRKVFPTTDPQDYLKTTHPHLLKLAQRHLDLSGLLGKKTNISEPITIPHLPELVGKSTLDEHFTRIGNRYAQPYLSMAEELLDEKQKEPPKPTNWVMKAGWTRYAPGLPPKSVEYPLEDALVFDVEVMYKRANHAVMCTAMSSQAWYGWVSPVLANYAEHGEPKTAEKWQHFIPMNTHSRAKLLVGYNVSYDRARVLEEYLVKQSKAYFLDAMALHIALSGFCSQQRPTWNKYRKHKKEAEEADEFEESKEESSSPGDLAQELMDDPWLNKGSLNSLASVAEFHCGIHMDKDPRDLFSSEDVGEVVSNFQKLMNYCAGDVLATFRVVQKIFPEFRRRNAHPVSFAALRLLGLLFLPTSTKWNNYINSAETVYQKNRLQVNLILQDRVRELVKYIDDGHAVPDHKDDPWLRQLNWTIRPVRVRKDGKPVARQAYLTGYPEWYRDLFRQTGGREMNVSVRTRITPLLLRLKWEGYPLLWTESVGWCFKVPGTDDTIEHMEGKNYTRAQLSEDDRDILWEELDDAGYVLFKVPHPDGPKRRCTQIMSKGYMQYFDNGVLTSEYDYAKEILNLNATASYWMGNRARIMDQFVVYCDPKGDSPKFFDTKKECKANKDMGIIIPKLCVMGTVTRRATENTWLTASNSKKNRIGSELKSLVQAPPGYLFVGADVDSEELWIASLIGDSMFDIHGGTALGWMTLEGDKHEKTDLHSKTAEIMGILRNDAKVFNYGRIYGAGVKFATRLLKQCNASLTEKQAEELAHKLYELTKGQTSHSRIFNRRMYYGGTESVMFNALESIAYQENPRTPVLGASITDALTKKYLNKNNYLTSRINWTIQSSGVDYLHLLIISMEYLIEKFKIDARLMITVHDELRYFVKDEHKLLCALLLQISNLWTRAMFCEQLGIKELPQSCAFFSEVDIDFVLRKEVGMDCITPSHPTPIDPGESYDIKRLLSSVDPDILKSGSNTLLHLKTPKYIARNPVIKDLDSGLSKELCIAKLALENSISKEEWKTNVAQYYKVQREESKPKKGKGLKLASDVTSMKTSKLKPKPKRTNMTEEYTLSKDGDDILRHEIEQVLGSKSTGKAESNSFVHAFGPPPQMDTDPTNHPVITKKSERIISSKLKFKENGPVLYPSLLQFDKSGFSMGPMARPKWPAGLVMRTKNIHTVAPKDVNFDRRPYLDVRSRESRFRRRRR